MCRQSSVSGGVRRPSVIIDVDELSEQREHARRFSSLFVPSKQHPPQFLNEEELLGEATKSMMAMSDGSVSTHSLTETNSSRDHEEQEQEQEATSEAAAFPEIVSIHQEQDEEDSLDTATTAHFQQDLSWILLGVVAYSLWRQESATTLDKEEEPHQEVEDCPQLSWEIPPALLTEIVSHYAQRMEAKLEQEQQQQDQVAPEQPEDSAATAELEEKCANLTELTQLLSKKLVESNSSQRLSSLQKRKEIKQFYAMMQQMEEQHRQQCEAMKSEQLYLQGQLRYHKKESVPPVVQDNKKLTPEEEAKRKLVASKKCATYAKPRRHSFMDSLLTTSELYKSTSTTSGSRNSFSMASSMILQNQFLPAMLSAMANANNKSASSKE